MDRKRAYLLFVALGGLLLAAAWGIGGHVSAAPSSAYVAYAGSDGNIWRVSADGLAQAKLTNDGTADFPVWVPGGGQIAYTTRRDQKTTLVATTTIPLGQIYVMGSDGTNQHSISDGTGDDRFADVSADGQSVLVVRDHNFRVVTGTLTIDTQLLTMPLAGGAGRVVSSLVSTPQERYDSFPARISPDGTTAVLVREAPGHNSLLVTISLTSGVQSLITPQMDQGAADGTVQYLWPQWTPDGHIVVLRRVYPYNLNGNMLVSMDALGRNAAVLLSNLTFEAMANGFSVDWTGRNVVGARAPEMPGGQRPEEIYLVSLDSRAYGTPIADGHAPSFTGALGAPPPPATATPAPVTPTTPPPGGTPVPGGTPLPAGTPVIQTADPLFYQVWERVDRPVLEGKAGRSWTWGPAARTGGLQEPYAGVPGDQRLVQYFDKARMELNPAQGGKPAFVTNGLLVVELLSGRIQVGTDQYTTQAPSTQVIGGDGADNPSPSYAALGKVASLQGENQAAPAVGQPISATLSTTGAVGSDPALAPRAKVAQFIPQTGHNIPDVFWTFLNQQGLVYVNGAYSQETIYDWVFTMGYPITEAYWTKQAIGGKTVDVLVQAYQRQVLTYTPANAPVWQVQLGNVAQHYYLWRYGHAPAP